jgi:excisionase family DNA binding protein
MAYPSSSSDKLELQEAADALGVHYQTAYRWVRTGRLNAKMVGGRYLVDRTDVGKLDHDRRTPATPPAPRAVRLDHAADRMYHALVAGDETAAAKITKRLADEGASIIDLVQQVLSPPLRQIGERWSRGELTIWAEHRAAAIVERLLGELATNPRGRRRGVAAVAAMAGDLHSLPTTMAAVALKAHNWDVHHLGANLPPDELLQFCAEHRTALAVITVTNPAVAATADEAATSLRAAGTPTIVGGAGHDLIELVERATTVSRTR